MAGDFPAFFFATDKTHPVIASIAKQSILPPKNTDKHRRTHPVIARSLPILSLRGACRRSNLFCHRRTPKTPKNTPCHCEELVDEAIYSFLPPKNTPCHCEELVDEAIYSFLPPIKHRWNYLTTENTESFFWSCEASPPCHCEEL